MKDLKSILTEAFLIKKHQNKQNNNFVNLDLPSGTEWATCNIGANKPEDPGLLFQWGRTDGYKYDDKNNKFLSKDDYTTSSATEYNYGDTLKPEDDAAYQATKGNFKIPTKKEIEELINHTDNEWTELNGVKGRKFISKKDSSKWIFIPVTGYYLAGNFLNSSNFFTSSSPCCLLWSSSIKLSRTNDDYWRLYCDKYGCQCDIDYGYTGVPVRGILNK